MAQTKTQPAKTAEIETIADKGAAVVDQATETLNKGLETAQDGLKTAQESLTNATEQTADELRRLGEKGTAFVRENPGLSVAGAVGIGLLIGVAMRGRRY